MTISWFSCGVTSAVATKIALKSYNDVQVFYIDTSSEHPDSIRFLQDCEKWFGVQIHVLHSDKFDDTWDVFEKTRFLNGATGARCTLELKKKVRYNLEDKLGVWDAQVLGFDFTEKRRASRFLEQYPNVRPVFPLIDHFLTKSDCMAILEKNGIVLPYMYRVGFHNNNCIGCVKGGRGYWAKIRSLFPDVFKRMAVLERDIGHSCIKGCFLDELPESAKSSPPIVPSCSLFCDPDFLT